ncbi:MAG: AMP-binding protein, partial [Candidatus Aminicenantes bacterium]|nr:AMP-binding protein [Candidatus Aminicenantes bacterium]NIQ69640.1 AMP-binding protein [Candidatus Aminicenantes bacterium]NIT25645.1 AMP-binding protein [Candidatus Aminicenantes bacterium]
VFTYWQLDRYADCIAHAILDRVQPGSRQPVVSLLFEHGIHMIAALFGTLKAGCIYVPLDNSFPEGRLQYMLEHSETYLILTNTANYPLAERLVQQTSPSSGRSIGLLDIEPLEIKTPSVSSVSSVASVASSKIAYILYTSGSTGKPKGVYQTHGNVLYYIRNWTRRFSITEMDNMTLLTAFSHDGAAQDIFAALLNG